MINTFLREVISGVISWHADRSHLSAQNNDNLIKLHKDGGEVKGIIKLMNNYNMVYIRGC